MIYIIPAFTALNIILAFIDSRIIGVKRTPKHWLNGLVYLLLTVGAVWWVLNYWLIGALLFNRLVVFNICLSKFRGLHWDYLSPSPSSFIDRMAFKIFGNRAKLMYGVYLISEIIFTTLSLIL